MKKIALAFVLCLTVCVSCATAESPLQKDGTTLVPKESRVGEATPVVWGGKPILIGSIHLSFDSLDPSVSKLCVVDYSNGQTISEFGVGLTLSCAYVEPREDGEVLHVFAARHPEGKNWYEPVEIVHLKTRDLETWTETPAIQADNEHLLNSSVCRDGDGYLMAYETDRPVQFCFKFARSNDLERWEKVPDVYYAGRDGATYAACPVIRRCGEYYCVIYLRADGKGGYESAAIRSKDLRDWEESPLNPILAASEGEGINNSDVDLFEYDGKTQLVYLTGDQQGSWDMRRAVFDGSEREFWETIFKERR